MYSYREAEIFKKCNKKESFFLFFRFWQFEKIFIA